MSNLIPKAKASFNKKETWHDLSVVAGQYHIKGVFDFLYISGENAH